MKKIRLGIINSSLVKIGPFTKKGTEIFSNTFTRNLMKHYPRELAITSFCSGSSQLPTKKISIAFHAIGERKDSSHHVNAIFDMALFSRAISMQSDFDIFHFSLGNGEYILPFSFFCRKPIVVTMHGSGNESYLQKLFSLYKNVARVYFVTISNYQKKLLPGINYIRTIYHGVDLDKFTFHSIGEKKIIWTGRAVPEKGLDDVLRIAKKLKKQTKIFPIIKEEYISWLQNEILSKRDLINQIVRIDIDFNVTRSNLIKEYQNSKLFLFPVKWDEPFGLTMIESMACGTPIIAYARGSVPEIIKDGETGFIVNQSDDDIRGNWIVKKTGIEGLCEAVERIYAMDDTQYKQMRLNCRDHVEKNFTAEHMVDQYVEVYKEILSKNTS